MRMFLGYDLPASECVCILFSPATQGCVHGDVTEHRAAWRTFTANPIIYGMGGLTWHGRWAMPRAPPSLLSMEPYADTPCHVILAGRCKLHRCSWYQPLWRPERMKLCTVLPHYGSAQALRSCLLSELKNYEGTCLHHKPPQAGAPHCATWLSSRSFAHRSFRLPLDQ